jgi:TonB-linked SusC/RagA family outer membrane protein
MKKITFAALAVPLMWVLLLLLFSNYKVYAQEHSVLSGVVKTADGTPMEGVTVWQKETDNGTQTNELGFYTLEISKKADVTFEYIGYKTQSIIVTGKVLNVTLVADDDTLEELVINAGYYSVKDKERTGSISKITAKEIGQQPVANPLAAMQGRMAGVNITQSSGTPGGGFDIQIRGRNSLRTEGNAPLYIVDGVPYPSQSMSQSEISAGVMPLGNVSPLNSINPGDIESIEVLKDADATSIYGSRGSNGVVLITTKKGKAGKVNVTLNTYTSVGTVGNFMKLHNTEEYLQLRRAAFANDGITEYPANAYDVNGTWDQNRYTDWQRLLMGGKAVTRDIQFSLSGGSEQTRFLLSGSRRNEGTVIPGDFQYKRSQVLMNLNHQSKDEAFRLNFSGNFAQQANNMAAFDLSSYVSLPPNTPDLYDAEGRLNWEDGTFENPLANLEALYKSNNTLLNSRLGLNYRISGSLEAKINLGYNSYQGTENKILPHTMYNPLYEFTSEQSSVYNGNAQRVTILAEPQLFWSTYGETSRWEALVGATFEQTDTRNLFVMGTGFSSNILINDLGSALQLNVLDNSNSQYKYQAFFARLNYHYKDRYIINLSGRRDGSSRFGPNKRFANFGAAGVAWIFSRENFLESLKWLDFGKLRTSYGITGSDLLGDYQYLNTYSGGDRYGNINGIRPARLYNPDFSWEENRKFESALELSMFNNRLSLDVSYFVNRSSSQLVGIPLPGMTGFESVQANLDAVVENSGLEIGLQLLASDKGNFKWKTGLNLTLPKNKLISFPDLEASTYADRYVVGKNINIRKLYKLKGINEETGRYEFEDYNQDGQITIDDRKFVKEIGVTAFGGWHNSFTYKGFTLDFLIQFVKQQNYNAYYTSGLPGAMVNTLSEPGDKVFQNPTTGADYESLQAFMRYRESDAVIGDASYIRLKNIQLNYTLPEKWLGCRAVIFVQGQNLMTFTKYNGLDPEFTAAGYTPALKVAAFGFNLNF